MFPVHTLHFTVRVKVMKPDLMHSQKSQNKLVLVFIELVTPPRLAELCDCSFCHSVCLCAG